MNGALGQNGLAVQRHVVVRAQRKGHDLVFLQNLGERSVLQKHNRKLKSVVLKSPVQVGNDTLTLITPGYLIIIILYIPLTT